MGMNKLTVWEHIEMLYKFFFEKGEKVPTGELPQQDVVLDTLLAQTRDGLRSAWLGHSSVLLHIDGFTVLTDPVFSRKVSPIGPVRFNRDLPLDVEALPVVDVVIVSHDHYDHLNKPSIQALRNRAGRFIVPIGVGKRLEQWGVRREKIVELAWWDEYAIADRLVITATPAHHFSGRGLFDRNKTLWASWVISGPKNRVFFSGDTGYFSGFREIGKKFGHFDLAFLECGAYDRRWSTVHMHPEQTVQAFVDLQAHILHPVHWATFNLALHPWYEPIERLMAEAWRRKVEFVAPQIGEVVDYSHPSPLQLWWVPSMAQSRSKSRDGRGQVAGTFQN